MGLFLVYIVCRKKIKDLYYKGHSVKIFKVFIVVAFLVDLLVISAKNEDKLQPYIKYMFETRDN